MPETNPTLIVTTAGLAVALDEISKKYATKSELQDVPGAGELAFATEDDIRALFADDEVDLGGGTPPSGT